MCSPSPHSPLLLLDTSLYHIFTSSSLLSLLPTHACIDCIHDARTLLPQDALHRLPSSEVPLDQLKSRVKQLEETLAHREREQAVLGEKLKSSVDDQHRASQQYQEHIERLREEMNQ